MAIAPTTVKLHVDRSELDDALAKASERVDLLENMTLRVKLDMSGADEDAG